MLLDMLTILDSSSKRKIEILVFLLEENENQIKILANHLDVSEKTITDDLNRLNEIPDIPFSIHIDSKNHVFTNSLNINSFLKGQSLILLESTPIRFLKSLFFHPNKDLSYFAEHLHVSRSTLYRYVTKMNNYLKKHSIKIDKFNSSYFLSSTNELALRRFFSTIFFEIAGFNPGVFISFEHNTFLTDRINDNFKFNQELVSDFQIDFYTILYYLSIQREKQGFTFNPNDLFLGNRLPIKHHQINESGDLYKNLSTHHIDSIEKSILIFRHRLNTFKDKNTESVIASFLTVLFEKLEFDMNTPSYNLLLDYLKDLYSNDKNFPVSFHIINNRFTYFSKQVKIDNQMLYNEIKELMSQLSKETDVCFNEVLDYFLFILVTTIPETLLFKLRKKSLFVSSYSLEHANFLRNNLQTLIYVDADCFNNSVCISKNSLVDENLEDYQIVFSNCFIDHKNLVILNDFPTEKDIVYLKERILN